MSVGQGSHHRNPKWTWAFLIAMGVCILPGAALVTGQPPSKPVTPKSKQPAATEFADVDEAVAGSPDTYLIYSYPVNELIDDLITQGLTQKEAEQELLSRLPRVSVSPKNPIATVESSVDQRAIAQTLPPLPNSAPPAKARRDQTSLQFHNEILVVRATRATHKSIAKLLQHCREFGFKHVHVSLTFLEERVGGDDKDSKSLPTVGASVQSDAGVTGSIRVDDRKLSSNDSNAKLASDLPPVAKMTQQQIDESIRKRQQQGAITVLSRPTIHTSAGVPARITIGGSAAILMSESEDIAPHKIAAYVDFGVSSTIVSKLTTDGQIELSLELTHSKLGKGRNRYKKVEDGKTRWFDAPSLNKSTLQSVLKTKSGLPFLVRGPHYQSEVVYTRNGKQVREKVTKRLVVVGTCQTIGPGDRKNQKLKETNTGTDSTQIPSVPANTSKKSPKPKNVSKTEQSQADSLDARETADGFQIRSGDEIINVSSSDHRTIKAKDGSIEIAGRDLDVRFDKPGINSQHDPSIHCDFGSILIPSSTTGSSFDRVRCELKGNVLYHINSETRITAEELFTSKDSMVQAKSVRINFKEFTLTADSVRYHRKSNKLLAEGNVSLSLSIPGEEPCTIVGGEVNASELTWDLRSGELETHGVIILKNGTKVKASRMRLNTNFFQIADQKFEWLIAKDRLRKLTEN